MLQGQKKDNTPKVLREQHKHDMPAKMLWEQLKDNAAGATKDDALKMLRTHPKEVVPTKKQPKDDSPKMLTGQPNG